jgi:hypothetical protein
LNAAKLDGDEQHTQQELNDDQKPDVNFLKIEKHRVPSHVQNPLNAIGAQQQAFVFGCIDPELTHVKGKADHNECPGRSKNPSGRRPRCYVKIKVYYDFQ